MNPNEADASAGRGRRTFLRTIGGAAAAALLSGSAAGADGEGDAALTHGAAVGDVTADSAVVWARTDGEATAVVAVDDSPSFDDPRWRAARTAAESDCTAHARLTGLRSGTRYHYRVWAVEGNPEKRAAGSAASDLPEADAEGTFVTAPGERDGEAVTFAWSGDTYGYGSDPVEPPYPGLSAVAEMKPDFLLYLGDTIYADAKTPAVPTPPADTLADYRAKYREMRETNLRETLEATSTYVMWDDHEVINNFAGTVNPLTPTGRRAFFEYWPIDRHPTVTGTDDDRLYRSFRWGKHAELFLLDTRQYRDPNVASNSKTLLGDEQMAWLKRSLAESDATFKLLATPAPLGRPSDTWANMTDGRGYEDALRELVTFVDEAGIDNVVSLAGDVHHPQVSAYDPDDDGEFEIHEAIAGPLGAQTGSPADLYPPLRPTTFYAEGGVFNYGVVRIDGDGEALTVEIRDEDGDLRHSQTIEATDGETAGDAPERIASTFESDHEGWIVDDNGASRVPDRLPSGCIRDGEARGGIAWYYRAPMKFLGDRERFYGGTLSFSLRQATDDAQFDAKYSRQDVTLRSGDTKLTHDFGGPEENPGAEWRRYEIDLSPDEWRLLGDGDGTPSEAQFRAVLAELDDLLIRGEFRNGDDASALADVVLEA